MVSHEKLNEVVAAPPQQAPAQAPSPGQFAAGASLIIVLLIGFILWRAVDKKRAKPVHVGLAFTMGVLLSGSMIGVMAQQTAGSIGTGLATMFTTVTSNTTIPGSTVSENPNGSGH